MIYNNLAADGEKYWVSFKSFHTGKDITNSFTTRGTATWSARRHRAGGFWRVKSINP